MEDKLAKSWPKTKVQPWTAERLQVADLFEGKIEGKFATLHLLDESIDNLTENNHGALIDTASKVLSKARRKNKPWMTVIFWIYVAGEEA